MPRQIFYSPSGYGASATHYLVFFVTGNPGYIAYYRSFLNTLYHLLSSANLSDGSLRPVFHVYGQSLPGFEDEDDSRDGYTVPYGLQEVIGITLDVLACQRISAGARKGESFDAVIIIGHSVGSYILLELLRKIREKSLSNKLRVKAGILLFPTVMELAQSSNGVKFKTLSYIPNFPKVFGILVRSLVWPLPRAVLKWIVGIVTRMPEEAAGVTTEFLTCRRGIWQALHMARDEMEMISEDRWDEDIWGVEHPTPDSKQTIPKLIFYFGNQDDWVANQTRDSLIAARAGLEGQDSSKPKMLIDRDGIPHAFCIKHGELVAEKVKVWIDEIIELS